jgi:hypothetical protein
VKTLIIILLVYLIIIRLRGKAPRYQFPRPEAPRPAVPDYRPAGDDLPLPGPWSSPTDQEDAPLPGPWNRPARSGETCSERPDKPVEQHRQTPGKPEPQLDTDLQRDRARDAEQRRDRTAPGTGEGEFTRCPRPAPAGEKGNCAPGEKAAAPGRQLHRERKRYRAGNPVVAALHSKSTLAASVVLGEVLGPRGGRRKR